MLLSGSMCFQKSRHSLQVFHGPKLTQRQGNCQTITWRFHDSHVKCWILLDWKFGWQIRDVLSISPPFFGSFVVLCGRACSPGLMWLSDTNTQTFIWALISFMCCFLVFFFLSCWRSWLNILFQVKSRCLRVFNRVSSCLLTAPVMKPTGSWLWFLSGDCLLNTWYLRLCSVMRCGVVACKDSSLSHFPHKWPQNSLHSVWN